MRLALVIWCGSAALLVACPLPEDQFVLSGQVVDSAGQPRPGVEVRLSRNRYPSEKRCDALDPLTTTQADEQGRYSFALVRQQITGGVSARRFFRVESDFESSVASQTFWFPDADLQLGALSNVVPEQAWRLTEYELDGHVAARYESAAATVSWERESERRTTFNTREWRTVPVDSLGRYDVVPVQWELETAAEAQESSIVGVPGSRGGECPSVEATPCPFTDGRYLPFALPENTRTLVFNFKREVSISPITFHGLLLAGTAARVRFEFNFVLDFDNWNRLGTAKFDARLQERSAERCVEPGAFVSFSPGSLIKPVLLRVAFEDEAGDLVPILSLSEISTR
jgi:hypothetical protein